MHSAPCAAAGRDARYARWMQGKVIVITGASAGIGAALAQLVGQRGAKPALVARRSAALSQVASEAGEHAWPTPDRLCLLDRAKRLVSIRARTAEAVATARVSGARLHREPGCVDKQVFPAAWRAPHAVTPPRSAAPSTPWVMHIRSPVSVRSRSTDLSPLLQLGPRSLRRLSFPESFAGGFRPSS